MGDALAAIPIFSDELNKSVSENSWVVKRPLSITNRPMATIGNELLFGLYSLTE